MIAATCLVAILPSLPAAAHEVGLSRGTWHLEERVLTVDLVFARRDAARIVSMLGEEGANRPAGEALDAAVTSRIDVRRGELACPGASEDGGATEGDAFWVRLRFTCPDEPGRIRANIGLLDVLGAGHRHVARVEIDGAVRDEVLIRGRAVLDLRRGPDPSSLGVLGFLRMGVEHIVTGYDHLVFLFGLILVGGRPRSVLATVTAFTVAHSITLAVAALGVWHPGSRVVEPLIAATIAYVGVENIVRGEPRGRWRITFPLGLVHGFGFAGALAELGLGRGQVVQALVLFNVGVEVGQVAVLAVLLPLVLRARRSEWVVRRAVPVASAVVGLVGVVLLVERLV